MNYIICYGCSETIKTRARHIKYTEVYLHDTDYQDYYKCALKYSNKYGTVIVIDDIIEVGKPESCLTT